MPSTQRRAVLGSLTVLLPAAGCFSTPTETPSPPPSERIMIEVHNEGAAETTVELRLVGADRTLLDRQVSVPADGRAAIDTGIDETGEYELAAFVVGGPDLAAEFTVPVDEYDLREGSNVILAVDGERIGMRMAE